MKLGRNHKESKENNHWRKRKQHIITKKGNWKSGTGIGESTAAKESEAEDREDITDQSKHQRKETLGEPKGMATGRRDAEKRQCRPMKKRKVNEPKGRRRSWKSTRQRLG